MRTGRLLLCFLLLAAIPAAGPAWAGSPSFLVSVADARVNEGDEGRSDLVFRVTLDGTPNDRVRVQVTAMLGVGGRLPRGSGTARGKVGPDRDFLPFQKEVFFERGATGAALTKTMAVEVIGDTRMEPDETVILRVNNLKTEDSRVGLANGRKRIDAVGYIVNDDQESSAVVPPTPPTGIPTGSLWISVEDAEVVEGDEGMTDLDFSVTLSGVPSHDVWVRAETVIGRVHTVTATPKRTVDEEVNRRDIELLRELVIFDAGVSGPALNKTVTVRVFGDHEPENDEIFTLRFHNLKTEDGRVGFRGGGRSFDAIGTILDDDRASVPDDARMSKINATVLPQVAAAALSQTLAAVTDRIETVQPCWVGEGFGTAWPLPVRPVGYGQGIARRREQTGLEPYEVLDGVAFTLPVGVAGDRGAAGSSVTVWSRGEWVSLSGSERGVSWDGGLWSTHLGTDLCLRPDLLSGAVLSYSKGKLDVAMSNSGGNSVKGVHETAITAIDPYIAWRLSNRSSLWASVGHGKGKVRIAGESMPSRGTDLTQFSAAVGGHGVLVERGAMHLAAKGKALMSRLRTDAGGDLDALAINSTRLRLALEGSFKHILANGVTLSPMLEAGVRHDGGDIGGGTGVEVGANLIWHSPATGLTAELGTRILAAHERDRDEWGVSAQVRLDPAADGQGTFLTLRPSWGSTASGHEQLFGYSQGRRTERTGSVTEGLLNVEIGHGFGLGGPGPLAVLTPYAGFSLAEFSDRTLRLGVGYRLDEGLDLGFEAANRPGAPAPNRFMLYGALRW